MQDENRPGARGAGRVEPLIGVVRMIDTTKNEKPVGRPDRNFDDFCTGALCFFVRTARVCSDNPGFFVRRALRSRPILIGFCLFFRPFERDFRDARGYYLILKYRPGAQTASHGRLSWSGRVHSRVLPAPIHPA